MGEKTSLERSSWYGESGEKNVSLARPKKSASCERSASTQWIPFRDARSHTWGDMRLCTGVRYCVDLGRARSPAGASRSTVGTGGGLSGPRASSEDDERPKAGLKVMKGASWPRDVDALQSWAHAL
jgi:hypothetical protein